MTDLKEIVFEKFIKDEEFRNALPKRKFLKYRLFSKLLKDIDKLCLEANYISINKLDNDLKLL